MINFMNDFIISFICYIYLMWIISSGKCDLRVIPDKHIKQFLKFFYCIVSSKEKIIADDFCKNLLLSSLKKNGKIIVNCFQNL